MTNDPSMTITSTAPAPEGADNPRKESNTIPLPVTESSDALPAPDAPPTAMVQRIGNTTYEVSFHFSTTSQETMSDKINRLIRRELNIC